MKSFYANKSVLVTGGAGFIGSHLVEKLVESEAQVTVLDNLSTGFTTNLTSVKNKITFIHDSIENLQTCVNATNNIDIIFHLAANVSVPQSWENPEACYRTNVIGTLNILQAAHSNQVAHVVFSSSSAVYGSQSIACSEDVSCKPESPYGNSKLLGELLCKNYTANASISTICLRYFNVYGERQNPHSSYAGVIAQFKEQMKNNKPLTIFGDGLQERDFIPVSQVVTANLINGTRIGQTDTLNIGTGTSITLLQLIAELKREFPTFDAPIHFQPARAGDIKSSRANCSKWYMIKERSTWSYEEESQKREKQSS